MDVVVVENVCKMQRDGPGTSLNVEMDSFSLGISIRTLEYKFTWLQHLHLV